MSTCIIYFIAIYMNEFVDTSLLYSMRGNILKESNIFFEILFHDFLT